MTTQRPVLNVHVDGRPLPNVLSARVTRGFDQEFATGTVEVGGNAPAWVRQGSAIVIRMGATVPTASVRLVGYVGPFASQLWETTDTIECGDIMLYAKYFKPSSDIDVSGMTDQQIITRVFEELGVPTSLLSNIGGTGKIVGDDATAALTWSRQQTALSVIQEIDAISLGYKTFVDAGGAIRRTQIVELPTATPAYTFTEGVDILSGSSTVELPEPNNEVTIIGDGVESTVDDNGANTFAWHTNPYSAIHAKLQQQTTSDVYLSTEEVAAWLLDHLNRNLVTVNFATFRDDPLSPDQTIRLTAPHVRVDNVFWCQNVTTEIVGPEFTQQVQLVSERSLTPLSDIDPVGVDDPITGDPIEVPTEPELPEEGLLVSFAIVPPIDVELVIIDGVETTLYTVIAEDTTAPTSGTVETRAWTAAGPGVTITSGSEATFTTGFTSLTGASITLEVTDSLGATGTLTRTLDDGAGVPQRVRKLYALTPDTYEAFDGTQWRTQSPVAPSKVQAVGAGPYWGADHYFVTSSDDLATAPTELAVLPVGEDITSIWKHEADENHIMLAGSLGSIYASTDLGVTWEQRQSQWEHQPESGFSGFIYLEQIIVSIHDVNEVHVIQVDGWFTSLNGGVDWLPEFPPGTVEAIRNGDFVYLELSHTRNIVVTRDGQLQKAEDGTPFTFAGGATPLIVAATAMIRRDGFYAIAADGTTWYTDVDGSYEMVAGEPIPAGEVLPGGAYRDGDIVDLVYFAAQDGGIFKTIDGFRTADGYLMLREGTA